MSSEIFYCKTPIRTNQPAPSFVRRLKALAEFLKENGEEEVLRDRHSSSTKRYSKDGAAVIFDKYYEDKTITVEGIGRIHYSMDRNESYFDISVEKLNKLEQKLGLDNGNRRGSRKAA